MRKSKTFRPDRIGSYFRMEWLSLASCDGLRVDL